MNLISISKKYIITICIFIYFVLPQLMPPSSKYENCVIVCDSAGEINYTISPLGSLIGWGVNDCSLIANETFITLYPYFARQTILNNVASLDIGYNCAMAVKKDHTLWGWGQNSTLFLDQSCTSDKPIKIMDNVISVGVGAVHAAVIQTDESLWTWGYNLKGELGIGYADDQIHKPSKVLENVSSVYLSTDCTFAITSKNELYGWGAINTVCGYPTTAPTLIMTDVKDIDYMGSGSYWQILSTDNNVYIYNAADTNTETSQHCISYAVEGVKSICSCGLIMEDDSYWSWIWENAFPNLKYFRNNIAAAANEHLMISTNGKVYTHLFLNNNSITIKSMITIDPVTRISLVLIVILFLFISRGSNQRISKEG